MFITEIKPLLPWLFTASLVMFLGTLVVVPMLIVRIPADYFLQGKPTEGSWRRQHPVVRYGLLGLKNAIGLVFLTAGLIMLFTPGQGVITALIGLSLMDVPGKRRLEIAILRRPLVLSAINKIRRRAGRPDLEIPPPRVPKTRSLSRSSAND